jgi:hypothetical protein
MNRRAAVQPRDAWAWRSQCVLTFAASPARLQASFTIRATRERSSGFPEREANAGASGPAVPLSRAIWLHTPSLQQNDTRAAALAVNQDLAGIAARLQIAPAQPARFGDTQTRWI